jgi:hypothetical protein
MYEKLRVAANVQVSDTTMLDQQQMPATKLSMGNSIELMIY